MIKDFTVLQAMSLVTLEEQQKSNDEVRSSLKLYNEFCMGIDSRVVFDFRYSASKSVY